MTRRDFIMSDLRPMGYFQALGNAAIGTPMYKAADADRIIAAKDRQIGTLQRETTRLHTDLGTAIAALNNAAGAFNTATTIITTGRTATK